MKRTALYILTAVLTVSSTPWTLAQTYVGGDIIADETWTIEGSPYIVEVDVVVRNEATLTIDPGVEVRFDLANTLQIGSDDGSVGDGGTLVAIGDPETPDGEILFTSNTDPPAPGDWNSIWFANNATSAQFDDNDQYVEGSIIWAAIVEYAGGYGAVDATYSAPYIRDVTVRDCAGSGIHVDSNDTTPGIRIHACHVSYCDAGSGGGIHVFAGAEHSIRGNVIEFCTADNYGGGIFVTSSDDCFINTNAVSNNEANYGGGIYVSGGENNYMSWNVVSYNVARESGGGLVISQSPGTTLFWERVYENNAAYGGGAGNIIDSNDCTFTNCQIRDNHVDDGVVGGLYVDGCERLSLAGDPDHFFDWSNNIVGNDGYQIRANYVDGEGDWDIDATYLVWCTDDPNALILDSEDDPYLSTVIWESAAPFQGDLNGDAVVNLQDLAILLSNYGKSPDAQYEEGDLDLDGDVDLADLATLLGQYGKTCEDDS